MLTATGPTKDGGTLLLIGLSHENVRRLLGGQPIAMDSTSHAAVPDGLKIAIVTGETEFDIKEAIERCGAVGPRTKVQIDPRFYHDRN